MSPRDALASKPSDPAPPRRIYLSAPSSSHPFPSLAPRRNPIGVLAQRSSIQDLELRGRSCNILSWVRLFEKAAPLLEAFRLHANVHRPGMPHDMHDTWAVPPFAQLPRHAPAFPPRQRQRLGRLPVWLHPQEIYRFPHSPI